MRKSYGRALLAGVAGLVLSLGGCGDSTRNDQGMSFTFFGWYQETDGTIEGSVGATAIVTPLSDANPEDAASAAGIVARYAGLQNNLSGQFIRVERAYHSYYVPEAAVQPPDTSVSVAGTVGPATANEDLPFGADSTLPGSLESIGQIMFAGVPVVTADVRTFINTNRQYMPEAPFVMEVVTYVSGVTSSGTRVESNKVQIEVIWTPDNIIPPVEGSSSSAAATAEEQPAEEEGE